MLLSRVASALYAMGLLTERAEHVARVLDVHYSMSLDSASRMERGHWERVQGLLGVAGEGDVVDLLVAAPSGSISALIASARRAAQSIRPSISSEVWEALNQLHWAVHSGEERPRDLHAGLAQVMRGVQLVTGLVDETMIHDEGWDFIRLGRFLERASAVTRLVTGELAFLGSREDVTVEWAAVLRSCSAYEAFRRYSSAALGPEEIAGFLLLSRQLPRAAAFCLIQAMESLRRIDAGLPQAAPLRLLGRLSSLVEYASEQEVAADPAGFAASFQDLAAAVDAAIASSYFRPTERGPSVSAPPLWAQPEQ